MDLFILLAMVCLPGSASAALINVTVPHEEDSCTARLDTKKMSKKEFDQVAKLAKLFFFPYPADPVGVLRSREGLGPARAELEENLRVFEAAVKEIPSFRKPRWKKLGLSIVQRARVNQQKQSAALSFLETWNPALLTDAPASDEVMRDEGFLNGPDKLLEMARVSQMQRQPLEDRDPAYLSCEQKLRLLADESRLERFSARFAPYTCRSNGAPKDCEERYVITAGSLKPEREARRIKLFHWAWYHNGVCEFEKPLLPEAAYDGPGVGDLLRSALSGEACESNGCGD